jgi:hypothetical protein
LRVSGLEKTQKSEGAMDESNAECRLPIAEIKGGAGSGLGS